MDIAAVARGLATASETLEGVTGYPHMPLSVSVPAFVVVDIEATPTGICAEEIRATCGLLLGTVDDQSVAEELYEYASIDSDRSLLQALEADPTLGGACNDVTVGVRRVPRVIPVGTNSYLAVEVVVQIDGGFNV